MQPYYSIVHAVDVAACAIILAGIVREVRFIVSNKTADEGGGQLVPAGHVLMVFGQLLFLLPHRLAIYPLEITTCAVAAACALRLEWEWFPKASGEERAVAACLLSLMWVCVTLWTYPCFIDWWSSFRGTAACAVAVAITLSLSRRLFGSRYVFQRLKVAVGSHWEADEAREVCALACCTLIAVWLCFQSAQVLFVACAACAATYAKILKDKKGETQPIWQYAASFLMVASLILLACRLGLAWGVSAAQGLSLVRTELHTECWRRLFDWVGYALTPYGTELDKLSALQAAVSGDSDALLWLVRFRYGVLGMLLMLVICLSPLAVAYRAGDDSQITKTMAWACVAALLIAVAHAMRLLSFDAMFSVVAAVPIGWAAHRLTYGRANLAALHNTQDDLSKTALA